jgi:3-phytase
VHGLDGKVRQFFKDGPFDNVDLRFGFVVNGKPMVLVTATDRARHGIAPYLLDPETLVAERWGFIPDDIGEPYGICMGKRGDVFYTVVNNKDGVFEQIRLEVGPDGQPLAHVERRLKVATQPEGCVVDDEAQMLYVGEEDVAIWRFSFDPAGSTEPALIQKVDHRVLTDDVEGLTIMHDGGRKYLIASSQGDNTYPTYRIDGETLAYLGRFQIVASDTVDEVTETDGLDAWSGPIAEFPEGVVVFHDDTDGVKPANAPKQQNYKFVDWRSIKAALGIR